MNYAALRCKQQKVEKKSIGKGDLEVGHVNLAALVIWEFIHRTVGETGNSFLFSIILDEIMSGSCI